MEIEYIFEKYFNTDELAELFISVGWESGKFPDKLSKALHNYQYVLSARVNGRLVGLISALDDGYLNAYIHYLLVNPLYQKNGIGQHLIDEAKNYYKSFYKLFLIAETSVQNFYDNLGFERDNNSLPMMILNTQL